LKSISLETGIEGTAQEVEEKEIAEEAKWRESREKENQNEIAKI